MQPLDIEDDPFSAKNKQVKKLIISSDDSETSTAGEKSGKKRASVGKFIFGCCLLFLSVLGGSMIGPSSNLLDTKSDLVKITFQNLIRIIYCVPLVIIEALCSKKSYKEVLKKSINKRNVGFLLLASSLMTFFNFGLIYGAENLIQSQAYVCNTLFCIFIVFIGYCKGKRPNLLEIIGLVITIGAVALMLADPDASKEDGSTGEFHVYAICIGCAFFGALWILANGALIHSMPIFFNIFCQAILAEIFIVTTLYIWEWDKYSFFSTDKYYGTMGMFHEDQWITIFFMFGPSAGFFGNAGYIISLKFFSPVVVSAAFLFEPIIGQIIGNLL